jgi:uncharacterized protein
MNDMKKQISFTLTCLLLGITTLAWNPAAQAAPKPKHLLVVTVTKGFRHSSIPTEEKVLGELAQKSGAFTVDYVRTDEEIAQKMTPEALKKYDGVVFASTTGILPLPDKQGFLDFIKSGKAFIGMHSATDTFHGTNGIDPYIDMIGGEFLTHHTQVQVECLNEDPKHPATKEIGKSYVVTDEIYIQKNFFRDRVHGLLSLDKHPNYGTPGDYPIAWCKKYGKGNVFYTELGHREDVWESAVYQAHILGGIKWALGLEKGDAKPQPIAYQVKGERGFKPLFDGTDLKGWHLRHPDGRASWTAEKSMLVNRLADEEGKHLGGNDLVSDQKFRDFTVRYEYMVPTNSNSGFYLRGRHEIQILDDCAKGTPEMGGNGAIYHIVPVSKFVSKKPGEWQTVEATMKGNRVTVILNGVKVHDNVLVDKPTGSELDGNVNEPGAFMLQGDHGPVAFRNMRVKVLKD